MDTWTERDCMNGTSILMHYKYVASLQLVLNFNRYHST